MSVGLVVRQSLRESYRDRWLPAIVLFFAFLFGSFGLFVGTAGEAAPPPGALAVFWTAPTALLVPTIGLLLSHDAVAGRREDGRLRLLLGQPLSRRSIVLGEYLASAAIVVAAVAVGGLSFLLGVAVTGAEAPVGTLTRFVGYGILVGLAYLGISISASATFRTTSTTSTAVFLAFVVFIAVWRFVPEAILALSGRAGLGITDGPWRDLVTGLSPSVAYERLLAPHAGPDIGELLGSMHYDSAGFAVAVMAFWILVLPAAATWRFTETDL